MAKIHNTNIEGVNYKYHEAKPNKNGQIKGLMYTKVDKDTGKVKLKSGNGRFEKLMLKARGYNRMTENTGLKFLRGKFPNAGIPPDLKITTTRVHSSSSKSSVVLAETFQTNFQKQSEYDKRNLTLLNPKD
jgi:hypothetical protein